MTIDDLNKMKLHEEMEINPRTRIMCVPGGWVYLFYDADYGVFVPRHYSIHGVDFKPQGI